MPGAWPLYNNQGGASTASTTCYGMYASTTCYGMYWFGKRKIKNKMFVAVIKKKLKAIFSGKVYIQ